MKTETMEQFPTASDVLKRARQHIARGWCQWALARDDRGLKVSPYDPIATQMCAVGALVLSQTEMGIGTDVYEAAVKKLASTATGGSRLGGERRSRGGLVEQCAGSHPGRGAPGV